MLSASHVILIEIRIKYSITAHSFQNKVRQVLP